MCHTSDLKHVTSCLLTLILRSGRKRWPFPPCRCAAPPSLWQMIPCWSFSPPGRIQPVWSGGSSAEAPWGPSERAGAAAPGPAPRLPTGTRCALLRTLPQPPCPPERASLLRLASRTGPGPHVAASHAHTIKSKNRTVHIEHTHMHIHSHTHTCWLKKGECW